MHTRADDVKNTGLRSAEDKAVGDVSHRNKDDCIHLSVVLRMYDRNQYNLSLLPVPSVCAVLVGSLVLRIVLIGFLMLWIVLTGPLIF